MLKLNVGGRTRETMTICIAAICNNLQNVVMASDRMVTASYPPIEFEHRMPKLEELSKTCLALTAGDALAHVDLCRRVAVRISRLVGPSIAEITDVVKESYVYQRSNRIEELFLKPRGFDIETFYKQAIRGLPEPIAITLDRQIQTFDYGLEMIIAGVDDGKGHIYGVRNPGVVDCYDALGYNAIGSGELHALSTLILNDYVPTSDVKHAVYLVYEAKRHAEVAPGVGKLIDVAIITDNGCQKLSPQVIENLAEIYEKKSAPVSQEVDHMIDNLDL